MKPAPRPPLPHLDPPPPFLLPAVDGTVLTSGKFFHKFLGAFFEEWMGSAMLFFYSKTILHRIF